MRTNRGERLLGTADSKFVPLGTDHTDYGRGGNADAHIFAFYRDNGYANIAADNNLLSDTPRQYQHDGLSLLEK